MDCNSLSEKLAYLMVTMQNAEDLVGALCAALCVLWCLFGMYFYIGASWKYDVALLIDY
jgi:hypothetical protein